MGNLLFVKLGGSLITDKNKPRTVRLEVLDRLAAEIKSACLKNPDLQLIIGHGSGSYGHQSAKRHKTVQGAHSHEQWLGFAEVWKDARDLNQIVINSLTNACLPVLAFPPSAWVVSQDRQILNSFEYPISSALQAGLIPVVQGDVIFDLHLGGTILSTEDIFFHLTSILHPNRILLAGVEPGIWDGFPVCTRILQKINPGDEFLSNIKGSASVDVTGGMKDKVFRMFQVLEKAPEIKISIFSGLEPNVLNSALLGNFPGTTLCKA
jgi:isopentenyl phosphate kinase